MSRFNPLEHPICLSHPLRLAPTAELAHVPVAMFLVDVLRPEVLVQLGVSEGALFCAYAQAVKYLGLRTRCFAIGDWSNSHGEGGDSSHLSNLRAHHDPLYGKFSQLVQGAPGKAHTDFENGAIDLLHIRAFSPDDDLKEWFERWLPRMSNRGVVILENINVRSNTLDVWKVWKDLSNVHPHFEFPHQGGLGVVSVGKLIPKELVAILEASDAEASMIREFFRQSGERIKSQLTKPEVGDFQSRVKDLFGQLQGKILELEEKGWAIQSLHETLEMADRASEETRWELDEQYAKVDRLTIKEAQLNSILNSRAWRWVSRYGRLKMRYLSPVYRRLRPATDGSLTSGDPQIPPQIPFYDAWLEVNEWNERRKNLLLERLSRLTHPPLLSVVMLVHDAPSEFLDKAIESVVSQVYQHWELCITEAPGIDSEIKSQLLAWRNSEPRIRSVSAEKITNVGRANDDDISPQLGHYLVFMDQHDEIEPDALGEIALYLEAQPDTEILYSDDDKIDAKGLRFDPVFKADGYPPSALTTTYPDSLIGIRKDLFLEAGGIQATPDTYPDPIQKAIGRADRFGHIPKVLLHRRAPFHTKKGGSAESETNHTLQAAPSSPDTEELSACARTTAPETLKPIRTLMCAFNLNLEGAPQSQYELTIRLKQKGIVEPVVYSPVDGPLRQDYERQGIEVKVRPHPLTSVTSRLDYESRIESFARSIKNWRVELVYGNTLQTFYAIDAAHRLNLPSIWNPRESEPWQTYFDFLPAEIRDRGLQCFSYPYQVVFVSNASLNAFRPLNSRHNFTVIHNGMNRDRFNATLRKWPRSAARKQLGILETEILVLLVGTVCERKGQMDLIRAVEQFPEHIAQTTRFLIVGDRSSPYSRELRRVWQRLPYTRRMRVKILPEMSDIGLFYTAADCFVCTSRVESFPRVILEALAAGLPIITTPVFGIAEQVQPDVSALFYQPGDTQALATAISTLIEDPDVRQKLAANAGPALDSLINFESMVDAYAQFFREAWLSGSSRAHR